MDNCGKPRANTCIPPDSVERKCSLATELAQVTLGHMRSPDERANCTALAGNGVLELLTYQLPTLGYWPTVAMTGDGELGFDSGEGACQTATRSKEGSRRANYPILTQRGSDKK